MSGFYPTAAYPTGAGVPSAAVAPPAARDPRIILEVATDGRAMRVSSDPRSLTVSVVT